MRIELDLTDQEVSALEMIARARQVRIVAGAVRGEPEDRAIAKVLLAVQAVRPEGTVA